MTTIRGCALLAALLAVLALAACGGGRGDEDAGATAVETTGQGLSGRIEADGSSTVGPYTTAAAERFRDVEPDVQTTVGVSGTGGGFERFCRGETDLSNASRPIEDDEAAACEQEGVEFVEFQVANDALTIVVNSENDWATCLTVPQLKQIWEPSSKVESWQDVDASFPDERLTLFGPGTDSGTFDYFTDAIVGEEGASRSDYSASEDDNTIVTGVSGEKGGLGYFGFSYFEENQDTLKARRDRRRRRLRRAERRDGAGRHVHAALAAALRLREDRIAGRGPRSRPSCSTCSTTRREIAEASQFVPLTDEQLEQARADFESATKAG